MKIHPRQISLPSYSHSLLLLLFSPLFILPLFYCTASFLKKNSENYSNLFQFLFYQACYSNVDFTSAENLLTRSYRVIPFLKENKGTFGDTCETTPRENCLIAVQPATWDTDTLKVTQVNSPTTAPGKWFLVQIYLQMPIKISAGSANLSLPQVTGGKLRQKLS